MKKYLAECLYKVDCNDTNTYLYSLYEKPTNNIINDNDLFLLIKCLKFIISNDFAKIRKLGTYLNEIAGACNAMAIPIV
jgi:hypothetical protein